MTLASQIRVTILMHEYSQKIFLDNYVYLLSSWFSRFHTDSVEECEQAVQI
jgi:hypothetical protein